MILDSNIRRGLVAREYNSRRARHVISENEPVRSHSDDLARATGHAG